MKYIMGIFLLLILAIAPTYALECNEPIAAYQFPNIIIHAGNLFNPIAFQFLDGTPITPREMNNVLNIPENESVLRDLRRITVGRRVYTGLALAGFVGTLIYLTEGWENWPGYEIGTSMFMGVWLGAWIGTRSLRNAEHTRLMMAVDNFNMSIMGIPVTSPRR